MTENQFPKDLSSNGILYPSEANMFANAGTTLKVGSSPILVSGTAVQYAGSMTIPAGSLTNPTFLNFKYFSIDAGGTGFSKTVFYFSGLSANGSYVTGSINSGNIGEYDLVVGSPMINGLLTNKYRAYNGGTETNYGLTGFDHVNTSQALLVKWGYICAGSWKFAHYKLSNDGKMW